MCVCSRKTAGKPVSGCATSHVKKSQIDCKRKRCGHLRGCPHRVFTGTMRFSYFALVSCSAAPLKYVKIAFTSSSVGATMLMLK